MSAFGSLQHIFENPSLPENPTLLESLSFNQITPIKHSSPSFTEIFGELHFKETPQPPPSSNSSSSSFSELIHTTTTTTTTTRTSHKSSDSFSSSLSSESLLLCTEGLGFESSDDVEELKNDKVNNSGDCYQSHKKHLALEEDCCDGEWRTRTRTRSRVNNNEVDKYPPPISCIGRSGKPWVSFMSYRNNGRFVLKQIRVPTHEFLHAHRKDGRLKLHFVHPDDDDDDDDEEEFHQEENGDNDEGEEDYDDEKSTGEGEENDHLIIKKK